MQDDNGRLPVPATMRDPNERLAQHLAFWKFSCSSNIFVVESDDLDKLRAVGLAAYLHAFDAGITFKSRSLARGLEITLDPVPKAVARKFPQA